MKGIRTILFSLFVIVVGAIDAFDWAEIIPDRYEEWVLPVIGVAILYLRKITTTPWGFQGKK